MAAGSLPAGFRSPQGSTMPKIDRNERARIMFTAEAYDRRTKTPGSHGGAVKRTGLAVLKALLFGFHNVATGRCDPGYDALARVAGVARSTVAVALARLEAAGLIVRTRRQAGAVRFTNAYAFSPKETTWSDSRSQTTTKPIEQPKTAKTGPTGGRVRALLGALDRRERRLGLRPAAG